MHPKPINMFKLLFLIKHAIIAILLTIASLSVVTAGLPSTDAADSVRIENWLDSAIQFQFRNPLVSVEFAKKAREASILANDDRRLLRADFILAFYYLRQDSISKALPMYNSVIAKSRELDDFQTLSRAYTNLGIYYTHQGQFDSSSHYLDMALSTAERNRDTVALAKIYGNKGVLEEMKGDLLKAGEHFYRSMELNTAIGDSLGISRCLSNISELHYRQQEFDKCIYYLKQAIALREAMKSKVDLAHSYSNLGSVYIDIERYDSARIFLMKTLELANSPGFDARIKSSTLNNLGSVNKKMGNYDDALQLIKESLAISMPRNDVWMIQEALMNLGETYTARGSLEEAEDNYLKALNYAQADQFKVLRQRIYFKLSALYGLMEDYGKAYHMQSKYIALKDSLNATEKEKALAELQTKYESEQQKSEILDLKKNMKIKDLTISRNKIIMLSAILISILSLGMVLLYFNRYKLKKSAAEEKDLLLREIHHRVKNNLQIILSLLNIQARKTHDDKVLETIREGQTRVQSMALIHQKLYQSESLKEIDMQEYLEQLGEYLLQVFNVHDKRITIHTFAPGIYLDINTSIPLGLIINELLSNALKYAFAETDEGDISIRIIKAEDTYYLSLSDSGKGLPDEMDIHSGKTLGLKLVNLLVQQLNGQFTIEKQKGAHFKIQFKEVV